MLQAVNSQPSPTRGVSEKKALRPLYDLEILRSARIAQSPPLPVPLWQKMLRRSPETNGHD
jgi:hypothetical protein